MAFALTLINQVVAQIVRMIRSAKKLPNASLYCAHRRSRNRAFVRAFENSYAAVRARIE